MKYLVIVLALAGLIISGCSGSDAESADSAAASDGELSTEQMEKGIGPITQVALADVDASMAKKGEEIFEMKCTACHKMSERYVGPPLGDVLDRRKPEYVMNMILNTQEMLEKHPAAKQLLAEYMTPMPNQSLTEEDARAILEYLRAQKGAVTAQ